VIQATMNNDERLDRVVGLLDGGRMREALESLDALLAADRESARAWYLKGCAVQALGDWEQARACFDMSVRLDASSSDALVNLGRALDELGRCEEAVTCYDRALRLAPADVMALSNRANSLARLGRTRESTASLRRAHDIARTVSRDDIGPRAQLERSLTSVEEYALSEATRTGARMMRVTSRSTVDAEIDGLEPLVLDLRKHYGRSVEASGTASKWVAASFGRAVQRACGWGWVFVGEPAIVSPDRRWIIFVFLVAHDIVSVSKRPIAFRAIFDAIRTGALPAAEPRSYFDVMPVPADSPVRARARASRL
jgi:Tfp pilus assembly protein PilF